jgi:hypothetical protein
MDCSQPLAKTIVANHVGYIDILVLMATCFPSFVAKVSMNARRAQRQLRIESQNSSSVQSGTKRVPFVGFVARTMKCVFVENARQMRDLVSSTPQKDAATPSSGLAASVSAAFGAAASRAAQALLPSTPATTTPSKRIQPTTPQVSTSQRESRPSSRSAKRGRPHVRTGSQAVQAHQAMLQEAQAEMAAHIGYKDYNNEDGSPVWMALHAIVWPRLCAWGLVDDDDVNPPLCVFSEGTTTNGADIIQFRSGAFIQGQPVQPVVLTYHWRNVSPSWETVPNHQYGLNMLSQFGHAVTITYLPVVEPADSVQDLVSPSLVSQDPIVQELTSSHNSPAAFGALVRARMRHYLALRHAHESNAAALPAHYAAALNCMPSRLLFPLPGSGVPAPPLLIDVLRQFVFGSGYLWFQPFWASHITAPGTKWALHARIKSGRVPWQWWHSEHEIPRALDEHGRCLSTVPDVGGAAGLCCRIADAVLPVQARDNWLLQKLLYSSVAIAAKLGGDACVFPGWPGQGPAAELVFSPPAPGALRSREAARARLDFSVPSSVHSATGALVASALSSTGKAVTLLTAQTGPGERAATSHMSPGSQSAEDPPVAIDGQTQQRIGKYTKPGGAGSTPAAAVSESDDDSTIISSQLEVTRSTRRYRKTNTSRR